MIWAAGGEDATTPPPALELMPAPLPTRASDSHVAVLLTLDRVAREATAAEGARSAAKLAAAPALDAHFHVVRRQIEAGVIAAASATAATDGPIPPPPAPPPAAAGLPGVRPARSPCAPTVSPEDAKAAAVAAAVAAKLAAAAAGQAAYDTLARDQSVPPVGAPAAAVAGDAVAAPPAHPDWASENAGAPDQSAIGKVCDWLRTESNRCNRNRWAFGPAEVQALAAGSQDAAELMRARVGCELLVFVIWPDGDEAGPTLLVFDLPRAVTELPHVILYAFGPAGEVGAPDAASAAAAALADTLWPSLNEPVPRPKLGRVELLEASATSRYPRDWQRAAAVLACLDMLLSHSIGKFGIGPGGGMAPGRAQKDVDPLALFRARVCGGAAVAAPPPPPTAGRPRGRARGEPLAPAATPPTAAAGGAAVELGASNLAEGASASARAAAGSGSKRPREEADEHAPAAAPAAEDDAADDALKYNVFHSTRNAGPHAVLAGVRVRVGALVVAVHRVMTRAYAAVGLHACRVLSTASAPPPPLPAESAPKKAKTGQTGARRARNDEGKKGDAQAIFQAAIRGVGQASASEASMYTQRGGAPRSAASTALDATYAKACADVCPCCAPCSTAALGRVLEAEASIAGTAYEQQPRRSISSSGPSCARRSIATPRSRRFRPRSGACSSTASPRGCFVATRARTACSTNTSARRRSHSQSTCTRWCSTASSTRAKSRTPAPTRGTQQLISSCRCAARADAAARAASPSPAACAGRPRPRAWGRTRADDRLTRPGRARRASARVPRRCDTARRATRSSAASRASIRPSLTSRRRMASCRGAPTTCAARLDWDLDARAHRRATRARCCGRGSALTPAELPFRNVRLLRPLRRLLSRAGAA